MNLASRCREAISQVASLKKELARMHLTTRPPKQLVVSPEVSPTKKQAVARSSEASPRARLLRDMDRMDKLLGAAAGGVTDEKTTPYAPSIAAGKSTRLSEEQPSRFDEKKEEDTLPSPNLVSSDDYEEDDDDDDVGAMEPPSLSTTPPKKAASSVLVRARQTVPHNNHTTLGTFQGILREDTTATTSPIDLDDSNLHDDEGDDEEDQDRMPSPIKPPSPEVFPQTASPRLSPGASYNEGFPADITAAAVRQQHRKFVGVTQEDEDDTAHNHNSTARKTQSEQPLAPFDRLRSGMSTISSIDAFEASFQTDFPESFSPREGERKGDDYDQGAVYNPFSASPQRPRTTTEETKSLTSLEHQQQQQSTHSHSPSSSSCSSGSGIRDRAAAAASRRRSSPRWSGGDPPGKDRTSTRKGKTSSSSPPQPQAKLSLQQKSPSNKSTLPQGQKSPSNKSTLPQGQKSPSLYKTPPSSSSSSHRKSPPSNAMLSRMKNQLFSSSSSSGQTTTQDYADNNNSHSPLSSREQRPAFEANRARYEAPMLSTSPLRIDDNKNTEPRRHDVVPNEHEERVSPRGSAVRARIASLESSQQHHNNSPKKAAAAEEEDGEIPMRSSLSHHKYYNDGKTTTTAMTRGIDTDEDARPSTIRYDVPNRESVRWR